MSCPSIFIVSQGGCGSTYFHEQLGHGAACEKLEKKCICVKKHVKAEYLKSIKFAKNTKILYIYANPYDQILSIAKRNLISHLVFTYENGNPDIYAKIYEKSNFLKYWTNFFIANNLHKNGTVSLEHILNIYLDDKKILLDFKAHYVSWKKTPLKNVSIRFIKYDEILNSGKEKVCSWLGRDFDFKIKKRSSSFEKLMIGNYELYKKMEKKYGGWFNLYKKIPSIEDIHW